MTTIAKNKSDGPILFSRLQPGQLITINLDFFDHPSIVKLKARHILISRAGHPDCWDKPFSALEYYQYPNNSFAILSDNRAPAIICSIEEQRSTKAAQDKYKKLDNSVYGYLITVLVDGILLSHFIGFKRYHLSCFEAGIVEVHEDE